jgi:hypothetical protein
LRSTPKIENQIASPTIGALSVTPHAHVVGPVKSQDFDISELLPNKAQTKQVELNIVPYLFGTHTHAMRKVEKSALLAYVDESDGTPSGNPHNEFHKRLT